jgi:hypothetical protein
MRFILEIGLGLIALSGLVASASAEEKGHTGKARTASVREATAAHPAPERGCCCVRQ